jgi:hypothetical protein
VRALQGLRAAGMVPAGPLCEKPPPATWSDVAPRPDAYLAIADAISELFDLVDDRDIREILVAPDHGAGGRLMTPGMRYAIIHDRLRAALVGAPTHIGAVLSLPMDDYEFEDVDLRSSNKPDYDFHWTDENREDIPFFATLKLSITRGSTTVAITAKTEPAYAYEWCPMLITSSLGLFYDEEDGWSLYCNGIEYRDGGRLVSTPPDEGFASVLEHVRTVLEFDRLHFYALPTVDAGHIYVSGSPATQCLLQRFL